MRGRLFWLKAVLPEATCVDSRCGFADSIALKRLRSSPLIAARLKCTIVRPFNSEAYQRPNFWDFQRMARAQRLACFQRAAFNQTPIFAPMEKIRKYFPQLKEQQYQQFAQLPALYIDWNEKINVISRKDIDNIEVHHILHSLAIARLIKFKPGSRILDLGTGGGFPGIPLAIFYPEVQFHLVDARGKKIKVIEAVVEELGLKNVRAEHIRVEDLIPKKTKNKEALQYDFVVTRAVAKLDQLSRWAMRLIHTNDQHALPNGLIALKGGNLKAEIKALGKGNYADVTQIMKLIPEEYFEEKSIVYVQK